MHREAREPATIRPLALDLARLWTAAPPDFVRGFTNLVYRIRIGDGPAYLRLTASSHRTREQLTAEVSLLLHLGRSGVPVSLPLAGRDGAFLYERSLDGTTYFACAFREAPGLPYEELPPGSDSWFFADAGRTLARIHNALDDPACADCSRFPWRDDLWSRFAAYVPESERAAWVLFAELESRLSHLPVDSPGFGLVHGDFTIMNLRAVPGQVTAFDFDSSCRHWRAYDLACFLHYFGARAERDRMFAYDRFLEGYAALRPLTSGAVAQIPLFGKMRILYSFLVFAKEWGFEGLRPEQHAYFDLRRKLFAEPPTWPGGCVA